MKFIFQNIILLEGYLIPKNIAAQAHFFTLSNEQYIRAELPPTMCYLPQPEVPVWWCTALEAEEQRHRATGDLALHGLRHFPCPQMCL